MYGQDEGSSAFRYRIQDYGRGSTVGCRAKSFWHNHDAAVGPSTAVASRRSRRTVDADSNLLNVTSHFLIAA